MLRATVEWSHDLLDEKGVVVFARLATVTGRISLGAVRAVSGFETLDAFTAVEVLQRLVEQSMVVVEDRSAGRRDRLLRVLSTPGRERDPCRNGGPVHCRFS
jgi:predicted ATPase